MGRTFFGFGIFKTSHDGRERRSFSGPPVDENPLAQEFLKSQPETSHSTLGLMGMDGRIAFTTPSGELRPGSSVVREEKNPDGSVDAFVVSQGSGKKETHRVRFEGKTPRTMIQTQNVRVDGNEGG